MHKGIYRVYLFTTAERPEDYLQRVLFPVLLPGLEAMLRKAKETEVLRILVYIVSNPISSY